MVLLVNQSRTDAYNLSSADALKVQGQYILLELNGVVKVVAKYGTEDEAMEVFREALDDIAEMDGIPFNGSECKPYYFPE